LNVAVVFAAALVAAASVPGQLAAPARGAHCAGGGGRAIGDRAGKGYIRQEFQVVTRDAQLRVLGYVYSSSDGNDYVDRRPSEPSQRVHLLQDGEIDTRTEMMRYCFSGAWTAPWGYAAPQT
jgi:hypothetical protein